jgi:hypothetical protein
LLLESNPLKATPRKKKGEKTPIPENETPEQRATRLMDDTYTVYDFTKVNRDAMISTHSEPVDLCERGEYVKPDATPPKAVTASESGNSAPAV